MVALHPSCEQPGVEATHRHDQRNLKRDPDVYTAHLMTEDVVDLCVVECEPNKLVQHSGKDEEPCKAASERIPTLLRVVKRFAEDVLKKVSVKPESDKQERRKHGIEDRHFDLNPHGITGDNRQSAENDRDCRGDQREDRWAAEHVEHDSYGKDGGEDKRPRASVDVVDSVDDEHRRQRTELAEDVDGLLSIEREEAPLAGHGLWCFRLWRADHAVSRPGNSVSEFSGLKWLQIINTFADANRVNW